MRPPNYPLIKIRGIHFKNPFVVLPKATELTWPNGRVTPELLMHYKAFARSEAALVIVGPATVVPPNSRKCSLIRVDQPKYLDGLRALSKIIYSNGAIPGIQITHPGNLEANELSCDTFLTDPDQFKPDKIVMAFRNACVRSVEVGFRYFELDAGHFLLLHRLIEDDRRDLVTTIFKNAIKAAGNSVVAGLRLHAGCTHRDTYSTLFLEMGGEIVATSPTESDRGEFSEQHQGHVMETLLNPISSGELHTRLKKARLMGMNTNFPHKQTQVMAYFKTGG